MPVHRRVVAAGAVVFRRADAGDAVKYLTHGGCAGFGEILTADHVTRASMFKYVVFTRITQPVADHGQGIFFGAGAGSSVQLLFPSGFTCSPLPSSSCCRPLSTS